MIDVTRRVSCVRVQVIDVVLVEATFLAVKDVTETGWLGQTKDSISAICQSSSSRGARGSEVHDTYEGSDIGAQTIAMLSGIITW